MKVTLNRALSKLGILSRAQATLAISDGRVRVNGRVVTDPAHLVVPERVRIAVDDDVRQRAGWRTILLHKPRGVVTTRRDPDGRPTVFDVLGAEASGLQAIGRLDLATSGLLLLSTDSQFANWITDPAHAVPRLYAVTVRGEVTRDDLMAMHAGVELRKVSARESHVTVELRSGKNREVRRLFEAIGHEVTRLKRVKFGGLELGTLEPGQWRDVSREELRAAFPGARISRGA
ncbi:MAG TPA: pseudouridine synthase [Vicinamibacterales bacterium]|nr:pseudouridine synthase [Vicinamibacterales bacterium]